MDWFVAHGHQIADALGIAVAGCALLANFVPPTSPLGAVLHFVGLNGPRIRDAVVAAEDTLEKKK